MCVEDQSPVSGAIGSELRLKWRVGSATLANSGFKITSAGDLTDAADKIAAAVKAA